MVDQYRISLPRGPRRTVVPRAAMAFVILVLPGCAAFQPDGGMNGVADVTGGLLGREVMAIRTEDDAARADGAVKGLLRRPLTVDRAVQVALLSNRGLQARYNELALAETDLVAESLPPNPGFSIARSTGNGALDIERKVVGDILALATLPFRSEIARQRFRAAQLRAAEDTLRLAADVRRAYYRAVAANELVGLLDDSRSTAETMAQLAQRLGETGSMNKLDQAREQAFYAETTADLATLRQQAASAREALIRLLGLWGSDIDFRLPQKLPVLPRRPMSLPQIEVDAVAHRIDLHIARMELVALATSLDLTEASRFVTLLEIAGIDNKKREPGSAPFRERGFEISFQVPIFDGGEVRVRQARETYNRNFNLLTEKAINIRSEARDAYRIYRSTYDIAAHYQRDVLPLRQIISEEMQLRFSSMQIDVFALVTEMRQRIAVLRAAIDARRNFWLAQSALQTTINGGGSGAPPIETQSALATPASGGAH